MGLLYTRQFTLRVKLVYIQLPVVYGTLRISYLSIYLSIKMKWKLYINSTIAVINLFGARMGPNGNVPYLQMLQTHYSAGAAEGT